MSRMFTVDLKPGDRLPLAPGITLAVVKVRAGKVRLGVDADRSVPVTRPDAVRQAPKGDRR